MTNTEKEVLFNKKKFLKGIFTKLYRPKYIEVQFTVLVIIAIAEFANYFHRVGKCELIFQVGLALSVNLKLRNMCQILMSFQLDHAGNVRSLEQ